MKRNTIIQSMGIWVDCFGFSFIGLLVVVVVISGIVRLLNASETQRQITPAHEIWARYEKLKIDTQTSSELPATRLSNISGIQREVTPAHEIWARYENLKYETSAEAEEDEQKRKEDEAKADVERKRSTYHGRLSDILDEAKADDERNFTFRSRLSDILDKAKADDERKRRAAEAEAEAEASEKDRLYKDAIKSAKENENRKQYEQAKQHYITARRIKPENATYVDGEIAKIERLIETESQRLCDSAQRNFSQGQYAQARRDYEAALKLNSKNTAFIRLQIDGLSKPATLYIYRKNSSLSKSFDVLLGNEIALKQAEKTTTITINTFGTKTVSATIGEERAMKQIKFVPGRVYYVRCESQEELRYEPLRREKRDSRIHPKPKKLVNVPFLETG